MINKNETVVIINPKSADGATKKRWPEIKRNYLEKNDDITLKMTEYQGHATILSREAILAGAKTVVAVGGDGTISEVVAGFFDEKGKLINKAGKGTALGIITAGSGSDFVRTAKLPKKLNEAIDVIVADKRKKIDVGMLSYNDKEGNSIKRAFINIAEAGIGSEVIKILEEQGKGLGSWLSYQVATVRGLISYKNKRMKITIDDKKVYSGVFNGIIVANGKYFGSGMKVAPKALLDDGNFDVVILEEMNKLDMILKVAKLQSGDHLFEPRVIFRRAKSVKIESDDDVLIESDGELIGGCPISFDIVPQAIELIVP